MKTVYKTVKPIGNMLTKAAGKANDFITKIAGHWEKGIGKLLIVLESIDLIMGSSSGAARFVADITQSVCAREASTALIGTDIFKPIEDAAPTLLSFARNFKESLFSLSKALLSEAWKQINDTLQKIVYDSKGVVDALNPLKPLGESYNSFQLLL